MSDNPGMQWDIDLTRVMIGYAPQDGAVAVVTPSVVLKEVAAGWRYGLCRRLEAINI